MLIAACSNTSSNSDSSGSDNTPKAGGTLRVMMSDEPTTTWDPVLTNATSVKAIVTTVMDTLTEVDLAGQITPSLAKSWEISPDGVTYTFKLETGVKFSNGSPFTSADVKYTIDRIKNTKGSVNAAQFAAINAVETPSPDTAVLRLTEPDSSLLTTLAGYTAAMQTPSAEATIGSSPVGTGMFAINSIRKGIGVKLTAVKDSWRGAPHLDGIDISFNADANARVAALKSRQIDFLYKAPSATLEVLEADKSYELYGRDGALAFQYLLVNTKRAPFSDDRVRRALFLALNNTKMSDLCLPGTSVPLKGGFLPPSHWAGANDPAFSEDIDEAKKLLAEAGYPNGFSFNLNTAPPSFTQHICTSQVIQSQLKAVGVTVTVNVMEPAVIVPLNAKGDFDAIVFADGGSVDPNSSFEKLFVSSAGSNFVKYSSPKVDSLVKQAKATTDRAERAKLFKEAQKELSVTGPWYFTYIYQSLDATSTKVKNFTWNGGVDYRTWRDIWLDS